MFVFFVMFVCLSGCVVYFLLVMMDSFLYFFMLFEMEELDWLDFVVNVFVEN